MTALIKHIEDIIQKRGPLTIADYMELALQHPEHGYYRKGNPLGFSGDFITAPEVSQMFGEMIGLWCADVWRQMGRPAKFALVELGPGRGTLMQDALRATAKISGFHEAMSLFLLESSETLQITQAEKLGAHHPAYLADLEALPALPTIAVANEFFDAMPIRQFEKTLEGWAERRVDIVDGKLSFIMQPVDPAMMFMMGEALKDALPGTVFEISFPALTTMRSLAKHVVGESGAALIIDYGPAAPSGKATLQAVSGHQSTDVLANPGEDDITVHVDFAAMKTTAQGQDALVQGPIGQGDFLQALGIELRADQLKRGVTPAQAADIDTALRRLVDPGAMGTLFKVMAIASPPYREMPGF